ncbi:BAG family molecular chaperone regulator 1-like [Liolophura sinensis]|uniref:BAG family molecular chaperone regulator 1-like n=1 Tax=Liolophura sinensis TaxID=3198878 RepID=UPI003158F0EC
MAAEAVTSLKLQLVYGQHKEDFQLTLPSDEAGGVLQVKHLAKRVEEMTGVPPASQRLIFKGKSLKDPNALLVPDGIKNGSKIMLIGKKLVAGETEEIQKLSKMEAAIVKEEKKLSEITSDLDGIHRGFLHKDLQHTGKMHQKLEQRKSLVTRIQTLLNRCDGLEHGLEDLLLNS